MEAYVYTYTNGKINEHHGHFVGRRFDIYGSHSWLVGCASEEGVVRCRSVWYREPNKEKAIKAFQDKANELMLEQADKFKRTIENTKKWSKQ